VLLLPGLKPNTSNVIVSGADLPTIAPTDICAMVSWGVGLHALLLQLLLLLLCMHQEV
jgi:hypothetical protein